MKTIRMRHGRQPKNIAVRAERLEGRTLLASALLGLVGMRNAGTDAQWNVTNVNATASGSPTDPSGAPAAPGLGVLDARFNGTQTDAFDGGHTLYVGDRVPGADPTDPAGVPVFRPYVSPREVEIDGVQSNAVALSSGPVTLQGLSVSVKYHAVQNSAVLRTVATFHNPAAAAVTVPVAWAINMGSSDVPADVDAIAIKGTSSGDGLLDRDDRWVVTKDRAIDGFDRPAITSVLYGAGAPRVMPYEVADAVYNRTGSEGVLAYYLLTVPAGETQSLLFFTQMSGLAGDENPEGGIIPGSALDTTPRYDGMPGLVDAGTYGDSLLRGMGAAERRRVVNWELGVAPEAAADSYATDEDAPLSGAVLANDTDGDGEALTARLVSSPSNGELTLGADGQFAYVPASDFFGSDSFSYVAVDTNGEPSEVATVTVTVNPVNDAPTAADDEAATDEDAAVMIDVLGNDGVGPANEAGQALRVVSAGPAGHGTVVVNADGTVSYTPAADFNGADEFSYTVSDDGAPANASATGVVRMTVRPVNDAPSADAGGDAASTEGDVVSFAGTGADVDGDALAYRWDFGDGASANTSSSSHAYADEGVYTAVLTVTDPSGAVATDARDVTVANAAPQVAAIAGPASGASGESLGFSASFTDAGLLDTHTGTFNWGDGSSSVAAVTGGAGVGTASGSHAYAAAGTYVVTLTVTDNDGGSHSVSHTVTVRSSDPLPAEIRPDPAYPGKTALYVNGTDGGDLILVGPSSSTGLTEVWINGETIGAFAPTGRIVVYAGGGNDMVLVSAPANKAWLYGEEGNDMLLLVNPGTTPPGGILFGGDGSDLLIGGRGRDILVGGAGADLLLGAWVNDMLISGETPYDDRFAPGHDAAWAAIHDGWVSPFVYVAPPTAAPEAQPAPEAPPAGGGSGTPDGGSVTEAAAPPDTTTVVEAGSNVVVEPEPTNPEIVLLDTEVVVETEVLVEPGVVVDTALEIAADGAAAAEVAVVEESAPTEAEIVFSDVVIDTSASSDDVLTSPLLLESSIDVLVN